MTEIDKKNVVVDAYYWPEWAGENPDPNPDETAKIVDAMLIDKSYRKLLLELNQEELPNIRHMVALRAQINHVYVFEDDDDVIPAKRQVVAIGRFLYG